MMSRNSAPLMELRNVSLSMRGNSILHDVSAVFNPGQLTSILGPNGAGKSTMISLLAGDTAPAQGMVHLWGREAHTWSTKEAARRRCVMGQHNNVSFPFLAGEVVAMGRAAWHGTNEVLFNAEAIARAAELAEIEHLLERPITDLSGGEKQRVALARTLAQRPWGASSERPEILLLDEPISAMDIRFQERTLGLMRDLADQGACVITVLHDLDSAAAYSDRILLLNHGCVVAHGSADDVCDPDVLSQVYRTPISVRREGAMITRVGPQR